MNRKVILLIICNEFCERYCFYGYRSILFAFLRSEFLFSKRKATFIVHLFVSMCYLFTLAGGFVSDFVLGKYKTILYLSILYFGGTAFVTYSSIKLGSAVLLYVGLLMIALGTGGIKPCVAAFGGDQIESDNKKEENLGRFFNFFYFAINLGSMLSSFISPLLSNIGCGNRFSCYPAAFGSSSILLATSIILFYLGSKLYVKNKPKVGDMFNEISNIINMMINYKTTKPEGIVEEHHINQTSENYNVLRILKLFIPITFFWMLFDQQTTTWVEQGFKMKDTSIIGNRNVQILSSQMQTFNSIFIILFIPIFTKLIYPFFEYVGLKLTPIKKMGCGIFLASLSFIISAYVEHKINEYSLINQKISILWQLPQYLSLTAGEIMLNMTGLEFAYSEAPDTMKTLILSCWLLTVTLGNFFVILYSSLDITKFINTNEADKYNFILYALMGLGASYIMFTLEKGYNKSK